MTKYSIGVPSSDRGCALLREESSASTVSKAVWDRRGKYSAGVTTAPSAGDDRAEWSSGAAIGSSSEENNMKELAAAGCEVLLAERAKFAVRARMGWHSGGFGTINNVAVAYSSN